MSPETSQPEINHKKYSNRVADKARGIIRTTRDSLKITPMRRKLLLAGATAGGLFLALISPSSDHFTGQNNTQQSHKTEAVGTQSATPRYEQSHAFSLNLKGVKLNTYESYTQGELIALQATIDVAKNLLTPQAYQQYLGKVDLDQSKVIKDAGTEYSLWEQLVKAGNDTNKIQVAETAADNYRPLSQFSGSYSQAYTGKDGQAHGKSIYGQILGEGSNITTVQIAFDTQGNIINEGVYLSTGQDDPQFGPGSADTPSKSAMVNKTMKQIASKTFNLTPSINWNLQTSHDTSGGVGPGYIDTRPELIGYGQDINTGNTVHYYIAGNGNAAATITPPFTQAFI